MSQIQLWDDKFNDIFGGISKPPGQPPSKEQSDLVNEFGGIRANQYLYKKDIDNAKIVGMFWPWQDDARVTLKLFMVYQTAIKKIDK